MYVLIFVVNFCKGLDLRVKKILGFDMYVFKIIIFDLKIYKEVG